jgi:transcriptional accessory protein Tex/SPT6
MIENINEVEAGELFDLPVEDRKKVIDAGVDMLFQQILLTAQITEVLPSQLLNNTLANMEEQIKYHTENDNFELCYYFTEVFWETNKRLKDLRKGKGSVFV